MKEHQYEALTPRERDVLRALPGRRMSEIARHLGRSENTVKTHLSNARRKLGGGTAGSLALALIAFEQSHPKRISPDEVMASEPIAGSSNMPFGRAAEQEDRTGLREPRLHPDWSLITTEREEPRTESHAARQLKMLAFATIVLAGLLLIALAIFGETDRILPHLFPDHHPH